jgi:cbb3-type cytochrome oxidase subunit 3
MAHAAWLTFLIIVLLIGMVYRVVWRWRRRAANHEIRAQAERDFAARVAGQLDENERRYGVTGRVRAATGEEIAGARRRYGVTRHDRVRVVTAQEIADARKNKNEWED